MRERRQRCLGGRQHRLAVTGGTKTSGFCGEVMNVEPMQTAAQLVRCAHDQMAHLGERSGARHAGRALGDHEGPDRLDRTVFGLGDALGLAGQRRAGGLDGVEGVGLATAPALLSVRSIDVDDADAGPGQELGEARPIGTGAFDAYFVHFPVGLEPTQQRLVAGRRGRERCGAEQATDSVQGGSHVDVEVRIDSTGHRPRSFYDGHDHPFLVNW